MPFVFELIIKNLLKLYLGIQKKEMDIFKILNSVPMVDMDPASDVEREEGGTVKLQRNQIHNESIQTEKKPNRRKMKAVAVKARIEEDGGLSVASIIEMKPPKKDVMEFLRMRIAQLVSEDSD
jgi:hypothetical protein